MKPNDKDCPDCDNPAHEIHCESCGRFYKNQPLCKGCSTQYSADKDGNLRTTGTYNIACPRCGSNEVVGPKGEEQCKTCGYPNPETAEHRKLRSKLQEGSRASRANKG